MAYTSWSVVFGEQPSAAKWNILGTNDASFNDGTGIGTNAIAAASLATDALLLGSIVQRTSSFSVASASATQVTDMSTTITVPSGGRSVEIQFFAANITNTVANSGIHVSLWNGTVGSGTQLSDCYVIRAGTQTGNTEVSFPGIRYIHTPSAGSITYNIGISSSTGTVALAASSTAPMQLWTKAI